MIIVNPPRAAAQSYAVMSKGRPVAMTLETLNGLGQTETIIEKEVVDWKTIGIAAAITVLLVLVLTGGKKE